MKNAKCCIILLTLLCAIIILFPVLFLYQGWKFVVYIIVYIYPSGIMMVTLLHRKKSFCENVLMSFYLGLLVFFAIYLMALFFENQYVVILGAPITSFFLYLFVKNKQLRISDYFSISSFNQNDRVTFLGIWFFLTLVCAFTLNVVMPSIDKVIYQDYTWHIGNVNQFSDIRKGLYDSRVYGIPFKYHFFSDLFLGGGKMIFGGEGWIYSIQYTILFVPPLLALSLLILYKNITSSAYKILVIALLTLVGYAQNSSHIAYLFHWASNANSVGIALPCIILLFASVSDWLFVKNDRTNMLTYNVYVSLCLIFLLSGFKGPFALLFLLGIICFFMLDCWQKKKLCFSKFSIIILHCLCFGAVYKLLLSSGTSQYVSHISMNSLFGGIYVFSEVTDIASIMGNSLIESFFLIFIALVLTATVFVLIIPFAIYDISSLVLLRREVDQKYLFSIIISFGGILAFLLINIAGNSQFYFLYGVVPFISYVLFYSIESRIGRESVKPFFYGVLFCLGIYSLLNSRIDRLTSYSNQRIKEYFGLCENNSYSNTIFEAFQYVRENTEADAVFATNKQHDEYGYQTYHGISAFGERQCYLEGYDYAIRNIGFTNAEERVEEMEMLFGSEWTDEEKYEFLQEEDIDYLFINLDENNANLPNNERLFEKVFYNDSAVIYKVLSK